MRRSFARLATLVARQSGQPLTFAVMGASVVLWMITGPVFGFSDTWQLVANTGTGLVTFLMVFLIQNSQNRDGGAVQAKLDELIRAIDKARESFIGLEHLTDEQIELIRNALKKQAGSTNGKQHTAKDSVDRVLDRLQD